MPFCSIIFTNFMKSTKIFCFWLKNRCRVSQKQHQEILQKYVKFMYYGPLVMWNGQISLESK